MKKILICALTSLAVSCGAVAVSFSSKGFVEADAASVPTTTGLYEQVTSVTVGQKLRLLTAGGKPIERMGGSPIYFTNSNGSIPLTADKKLAVFQDDQAIELEAVAGNTSDSVAFKCTAYCDGTIYTGYLADTSDASIIGSTSASWYSNVGLLKTITDESSFIATYDSENNNMHLQNVSSGHYLAYDDTASTRPNLCYVETSDSYEKEYEERVRLNLYQEVQYEITEVLTVSNPTKTRYYNGETIDPSGLVARVQFSDSEGNLAYYYLLDYDNNKDLFSFVDLTAHTSLPWLDYTVFDYGQSNPAGAQITDLDVIDNPNNVYNRVTSDNQPNDMRGTYVIAYDKKLFKAHDGEDNYDNYTTLSSSQYSDDQVTGLSTYDEASCITIVRNTINGVSYYHAKTTNGSYLDKQEDEYDQNVHYNSTPASDNAVTFFDGSYGSFKVGGFGLTKDSYDQFFFCGGSWKFESDPFLFKLAYDTNSDEITNFNSKIIDLTSQCDPTGVSNNISDDEWTELSYAFLALSADAQAYYANMEYTHEGEAAGSIENAIDTYDYVVSKYNRSDFMDRGAAKTLKVYSFALSDFTVSKTEKTAAASVLFITLAGVAPLTFFVARKRKQRN